MMHETEIEAALAAGDLPVLEAAFRALVAFPHDATIAGVRNVDALCRLLARVLGALKDDPAAMPAATAATIAAALHAEVAAGTTYAAGAAMVADHQYHWRGVFLQHAANQGGL